MVAIHPDNGRQGRWPGRPARRGRSSDWQLDDPQFIETLHCYISCSANYQDKSNLAFPNQPIGFLLITLLLWIPSGSALISYNLHLFFFSPFSRFFKRLFLSEKQNYRRRLAYCCHCEGETRARSFNACTDCLWFVWLFCYAQPCV